MAFKGWEDAYDRREELTTLAMVEALEKKGFVMSPDKEEVLLNPDGSIHDDRARSWIQAHPEWKPPTPTRKG